MNLKAWETQVVSSSSKVVSLKTNGNAEDPRGNALPPILNSVRQSAKKSLTALIQALFNGADDSLFEMADRSRNDTDQHLYFDSMRERRFVSDLSANGLRG